MKLGMLSIDGCEDKQHEHRVPCRKMVLMYESVSILLRESNEGRSNAVSFYFKYMPTC